MKRRSPSAPTSARTAKIRRVSLRVCVLLLIALLAFAEVIRPNQDAKSYTHRLEVASQPLQKCFVNLSATTSLDIFYAPDIPIANRKKDAAKISQEIITCRHELAIFDTATHQLLNLHLAGYTSTYRDAKVNQRQAIDVIGQSNDVLNQYAELASFLSAYYDHIDAFLSYTSALANGNGYFYSDRIQLLATQAKDMRNRASQLRQLTSPPEFASTKEATAVMMTTAAGGFENLVIGYSRGNDFTVNSGYKQIDTAVTSYDSTVVNLPFDQLIKSYIPTQVVQLPSKVENLLASSTE